MTARKRTKGSPQLSGLKKCHRCKKDFDESELAKFRIRLSGHANHVNRYYCKSCFGDKFSSCSSCGKPITTFKTGYRVLPNESVICDPCYRDKFETCNECSDVVLTRETTEVDGDRYCRDCIRRYFVTCNDCGDYVRESDAEEDDGDMLCHSCYENRQEEERSWDEEVSIAQAARDVTTEEVLKMYPGIKDRLAVMFDRSALHRSIPALERLKDIRYLLPNVTFKNNFTYINQIGKEKELRDLKSPSNSIFKALPDNDRYFLERAIDKIYNVKHDIQNLMVEKEEASSSMITAIKVRIYQDKKKPDAGEATRSIEGKYPWPDACHPKLLFIITKDPVALVAKSTSQCWESMSCEKVVRGDFGEGAFSDIANSNAICFIFDKDVPIARIMIRWCEVRGGNVDLGIEAKWYYCKVHPKKTDDFDDMGTSTTKGSGVFFLGSQINARQATAFLVGILKSKGYMRDYTSCKTPYKYMGYSDTAGHGKTSIKYE